MNYYNVNLFKDMTDPTTLKESVEWTFVSFPIKSIEHIPNCIQIKAKKVNKNIFFCFASEADI